jgi:hypothetical protein
LQQSVVQDAGVTGIALEGVALRRGASTLRRSGRVDMMEAASDDACARACCVYVACVA